MMRPQMGKQLMRPGKPKKMAKVVEPGSAMNLPDFKSRALRPGGMKRGGKVKGC